MVSAATVVIIIVKRKKKDYVYSWCAPPICSVFAACLPYHNWSGLYLSKLIKSRIPQQKEKKNKKNELWLFNNAAHLQSGSQTDPHFHVIPPFGLLKFDFIILRCRDCPARLCYIDAIKNVCVFFPPFNVISILRRHWSAGAPPQPKHLWKNLLLSLPFSENVWSTVCILHLVRREGWTSLNWPGFIMLNPKSKLYWATIVEA